MNNKAFNPILISILTILLSMMACANTSSKKGKKNTVTKEAPICAEWIHPDSIAYSILGRTLTDITFNPKKVTAYSVAVKDSTNRDNIAVEPFYVVDSILGQLNKKQIAVIDFILLSDGSNYTIDSIQPMIPHRPVIAFEFVNKNGKALVWYSPDDYLWGIRYDDKQICRYNIRNSNQVNKFSRNFLPSKFK